MSVQFSRFVVPSTNPEKKTVWCFYKYVYRTVYELYNSLSLVIHEFRNETIECTIHRQLKIFEVTGGDILHVTSWAGCHRNPFTLLHDRDEVDLQSSTGYGKHKEFFDEIIHDT